MYHFSFLPVRFFFLILLMISAPLGFSQEIPDVSKPNTIFLLTHLAPDENQDSCIRLSNRFDFQSPMKLLVFTRSAQTQLCKTLVDTDAFLAQSQTDQPFLLLIHGAGKTLAESVEIAFEVQKLYQTNVLIYHWPAMVGKDYDAKNLKGIKEKVDEGIPYFVDLLHFVQEAKNQSKDTKNPAAWSLFLHSIGNYYLESMVNAQAFGGLATDLFENLILNAPAVNSKNHAKWVEQLPIQKRIFIHFNNKDMILKGLRYMTRAKNQLGSKAKDPLAKNASYVNFSEAVGYRKPIFNTHSYYIYLMPTQSVNLKKYYHDLFHSKTIDFSDEMVFSKSHYPNLFLLKK
ncbi:MAG TPA: hypothetical protein DCG69_05040 [Bacteroidales bacterium]|nr:hypothetical protein [Bacteroidales bacterium]